MHKIREVLRQKWCQGRRHRQIARSLGISTGMVGKIIGRAHAEGREWSDIEGFDDVEPERRLYPNTGETRREPPNCAQLDVELRKKGVGPQTARFVEILLANRRHPEQGYRSCLGTMRLAKVYGKERLEAACARALVVRARSYRQVKNTLERGLDRIPPARQRRRDERSAQPAAAREPAWQALLRR